MVSRRFLVMTTVLAGTLLCAALVQAQRPGGGRFGGGFRGGGGGADVFGTMIRLLDVEKVQKELDLLPEQLADIQKARESQRGNRFGGGAGGERPNFREMSEKEREEFIANMRKEAEKRQKELKEKVSEYLLPHQMDRLQEIALQLAGVAALMDDEVAKKLGVSDQQKEKMATVQQESREQMMTRMRELFQGGGGQRPDRDALRKQMEDMRKDVEGKLVGVLTASQKSEWEKMQGKPFELSDEERGQMRGFRRGAPGGGGRFGGGRRGGAGQGGGRPGGRPAPDDAP